jgi:GDP-L-fucose synthase
MERKRVLVTGSTGLVGNAIQRVIQDSNYIVAYVNRQSGDLTKEKDVKAIFQAIRPHYVIHTAAKVGGIGGNMAGHAEYFYENILINSHVIHQAYLYKVEKLLAFSSVCVFPDDSQILKEEIIHNGPPFTGNFAYAHAKRMVDVQIRAYKSQYGVKNWCSVIPGNIYGTHDLYSLTHGHVIPSLIHKLYLAKKNNTTFNIWGDGKSLREFIFADDLANILVKLLSLDEVPERLLVSGTKQYSIGEVVDMLVEASGFSGDVIYDTSKPNGQRSRQSDLSLLFKLFPEYSPIDLKDGLATSYKWFETNYPNVRF